MLNKIMAGLRTALKPNTQTDTPNPPNAAVDGQAYRNESLAPDKWKIVSDATIKSHYKRYPYSFADKLSVMEYRHDSQTFELEDGFSQAVVLSCTPIPTEGRDADTLVDIQDTLIEALQKAFGGEKPSSWMVDFYAYKEEGLERYTAELSDFIAPEIRESKLTQDYLAMMKRHLKGVNREGGIFFDQQVTGSDFQGQLRQCKMIIYRRCTEKEQSQPHFCPAEELNGVVETFISQATSTGLKCRRDTGKEFSDWLVAWFNPKPEITDGDQSKLRDLINYPVNEADTPYGYCLSENVVHSQPISDPKNKCWWFDGIPHQYVRCNGLSRRPKKGQVTGEIRAGSGKSARSSSIMDKLPSGSIYHQTIVFLSDREVDTHIDKLGGVGKSDTKEALSSELAIEAVSEARKYGYRVYKASMGIFVRANPALDPELYLSDLKSTRSKVQNLMLLANMIPQDIETDEQQIESYLVHLPMNFEPKADKYGVYLGLYYDTDLIDLSPLWGREQGTGNPGFLSFNRGGELVGFDMFGVDKVRSSHCVLVGPQGSGKSATLNAIAQALMAVHRPRLYILDKGGSFRLMGDYFERNGLKVKRLKLTPGANNVHLCPYADSHLIFEEKYNDNLMAESSEDLDSVDVDVDEDEDDEATRDPMGEMIAATIIMITGGNVAQSKTITQTHRTLLEQAITDAAKKALEDGRQAITSDVCNALEHVINAADVDLAVKNEMRNFLVALRGWTEGFRGKLFNSVGETFDEDADVTIIDVANFSGDNYEAELSVVYVALSTHLFNMGEKHQTSSRDNVLLQDETHLYSTKELLAPFMATAVKLMRKLGIKALYATQNIEDFKYGSEKILKLVEWWIALNLEAPEIEELNSFRPLTAAQKEMMYSCTKQPRCYTEGVVMGNRQKVGELLVRFVPPSEILAYSMTDTDEKSERRELRKEFNIHRDIDGARYMAEQLDIARKIIKPEDAKILNEIHKEQSRVA